MERTPDVAIVPVGPSDAADLAHVHVKAWRETYRGLLPQAYLDHMSLDAHARRFNARLEHPEANYVTLGAEARSGLVGYCEGHAWASPFGGEAEIHTLYVLRAAQGEGVGRRLLQNSVRVLRGAGASGLIIWCLTGNLKARGFYERMGGKAAAQRAGRGPGGRVNEVAYGWPSLEPLLAA
jgi:ribosomal protein S18 acetylase RimI-like enzyme